VRENAQRAVNFSIRGALGVVASHAPSTTTKTEKQLNAKYRRFWKGFQKLEDVLLDRFYQDLQDKYGVTITFPDEPEPAEPPKRPKVKFRDQAQA